MGCRAPANYVAGLGRGATGFTTRSDIGPARAAPLRGVGRPADAADEAVEKACDDSDTQQFEEFEGGDAGLLMSAVYDEEDRRADEEWAHVDQEMSLRRKKWKEARVKQEIEKYRTSNPSIREQFLDLKRKLADEMSPEDWNSIPEIGDYSRRNKRRRFEQFVPVPDTLLEKARQEKAIGTTVDPRAATTDLKAVGEGRSRVLSLNLDRLSKGQTPVDPTGYLTDLKSMQSNDISADISDTKKMRLLLKSVTLTNPKHASGWIAAARLEEMTGKLQAARKMIEMGCHSCPNNEDVWLEACRLSAPKDVKGVLAQALKANPKSAKLWLRAAQLEKGNAAKSEVLKKGLEHIHDSSPLWKALVDLANVDDARVLLARAVECCGCVELWLALAKLETYDRAKEVLNKAQRSLPGEPAIWIFAATLEEANGSDASGVSNVIERAIRRLQLDGVVIDREDWLRRAEAAEQGNSILTCQAIVKATLGMGVDEEDMKFTWLADAAASRKKGSIETARAIYAHALSVPTKKTIWMEAAKLEKAHGTRESLDSLLQRAVQHCPEVEILWLMAAKEKWLAGDLPGARCILEEAFGRLPNSEEILLAAFKLEFESREPTRAKMLLLKARHNGGKERVWMKSAMVERELGNVGDERKLLEEGLKLFPMFHKLWLMLGQLEERLGNSEAARNVYEKALAKCSHHDSIPLWLSAASLAERTCGVNKARAILTTARLVNKGSPELWLAAIRAELRAGNRKEADVLMAKALQECPTSGLLWAAAIELTPHGPQRKTKSSDAFIRTNGDAYVTAAVARLFWQELKVDKARMWMEKAVACGPDVGDFWALYYSLELQQGTPEKQQQVVKRCILADPKHGERWVRVSKALENAHQPVESILKKVALSFGKYEATVLS